MDKWSRWSTCIAQRSLDRQLHAGRPRRSILKDVNAQSAELEQAEQELWLSAQGLLAVFACLPRLRRYLSKMGQTTMVAELFFLQVLSPDDAQAFAAWTVPGEVLCVDCAGSHGQGDACDCVAAGLLSTMLPKPTSHTLQAFVIKKLFYISGLATFG